MVSSFTALLLSAVIIATIIATGIIVVACAISNTIVYGIRNIFRVPNRVEMRADTLLFLVITTLFAFFIVSEGVWKLDANRNKINFYKIDITK